MEKIEIITYFEFNGNCEEAVNAYIEAFGGEIRWMSRFSESTAETPELIGR